MTATFRFTPRGRAAINRWNNEIQASIRAYHASPVATEPVKPLSRVKCHGGCGARTRNHNGWCKVCQREARNEENV